MTLLRPGIQVTDYLEHYYTDKSGHVAQIFRLGNLAFANTHLKWSPADSVSHTGRNQAIELTCLLDEHEKSIIAADCNDRPNGPVRQVFKDAGFTDLQESTFSAVVNGEPVAIDLLAARGLNALPISPRVEFNNIPNDEVPSDHIPLSIVVDIDY